MFTLLNQSRTFGVELEVAYDGPATDLSRALRSHGLQCKSESYNHETRTWWKVVSDSSIGDGWEVVSPPLRGQEGLQQVEKACRALQAAGATINANCGLHVHHDARDLDLSHWKVLLLNYARMENTLDILHVQNRRQSTNIFCRSLVWPFNDVAELERQLEQCPNLAAVYRVFGSDRFRKVNLQSFRKHGTVEFRQHCGAVNPVQVAAWVVFTQGMVEKCRDKKRPTLTHANLCDWWQIFRVFPLCETRHEIERFYRARRLLIAAAEGTSTDLKATPGSKRYAEDAGHGLALLPTRSRSRNAAPTTVSPEAVAAAQGMRTRNGVSGGFFASTP